MDYNIHSGNMIADIVHLKRSFGGSRQFDHKTGYISGVRIQLENQCNKAAENKKWDDFSRRSSENVLREHVQSLKNEFGVVLLFPLCFEDDFLAR